MHLLWCSEEHRELHMVLLLKIHNQDQWWKYQIIQSWITMYKNGILFRFQRGQDYEQENLRLFYIMIGKKMGQGGGHGWGGIRMWRKKGEGRRWIGEERQRKEERGEPITTKRALITMDCQRSAICIFFLTRYISRQLETDNLWIDNVIL